MIKWCPQKDGSWGVVEITDSCLARNVAFTAVLSACQEPSAYRTCRLLVARPEIVQEGNSSGREENRLSLCRSLLLGFIALWRKVSLLPISKWWQVQAVLSRLTQGIAFWPWVRFFFIINMLERKITFQLYILPAEMCKHTIANLEFRKINSFCFYVCFSYHLLRLGSPWSLFHHPLFMASPVWS